MLVYESGDIVDVFVKISVESTDTEVFDMIGICYWLVFNDDVWWRSGCWFVVAWYEEVYCFELVRAIEFAESHL